MLGTVFLLLCYEGCEGRIELDVRVATKQGVEDLTAKLAATLTFATAFCATSSAATDTFTGAVAVAPACTLDRIRLFRVSMFLYQLITRLQERQALNYCLSSLRRLCPRSLRGGLSWPAVVAVRLVP